MEATFEAAGCTSPSAARSAVRLAGAELNLSADLLNHAAKLFVGFHLVLDGVVRVDHRRMVAPSEVQADGFEGMLRQLLAEVHRDLSGPHHLALARFGAHQVFGDVEVLAHDPLNLLDREVDLTLLHQVAQHLLRKLEIEFTLVQRGVGEEANESAFELPDVAFDVVGDELDDLLVELNAIVFGLALQDGDARLESGRLHVGREAPLKARQEALLDALNIPGRAVGGENDLLPALVQGVEDVEEFFLRLLLAAEKLDVVDDQHVDLAVEHRKLADAVPLNRLHKLGGEPLAGHVQDGIVARLGLHVVAHGLNQVRFAEADSAVDEE